MDKKGLVAGLVALLGLSSCGRTFVDWGYGDDDDDDGCVIASEDSSGGVSETFTLLGSSFVLNPSSTTALSSSYQVSSATLGGTVIFTVTGQADDTSDSFDTSSTVALTIKSGTSFSVTLSSTSYINKITTTCKTASYATNFVSAGGFNSFSDSRCQNVVTSINESNAASMVSTNYLTTDIIITSITLRIPTIE